MSLTAPAPAKPHTAGPHLSRLLTRARRTVFPPLAGSVCALGIWELLPRAGAVKDAYFPPFTTVARALADELAESAFWSALADTLTGWLLSLLLAVLLGLASGVLIASVPLLRQLTATTIEFLRPIPSVALVPVAVLVFGTDLRSSLLLAVYAAYWQVLIQVLYGAGDTDPVAYDTARAYGLGPLACIRRVTLPTALPYLITGV
jgi:ABC-type nitrate/sulfonate/bicarbonate transport system permease component